MQLQGDGTSRQVRAPMLAGLAIVLLAAIAVTTIVALDRASGDGAELAAQATPTDPLDGLSGVLARAVLTSNLRATPGTQSDILAIVPTQQITRVTGRSADGEWLRLAYPADSDLAGWAPRTSFEVQRGDLATVAVASIGAPDDGGPAVPSAEDDPLPDLEVVDAYLLPNGSLTIVIENIGTGRFLGAISVQVTSASGELLGVLDTQPTTLLPNRTATVDTRLTIETTGSYLIELDRLDRIEESSEFNNASRFFLVATAGT